MNYEFKTKCPFGPEWNQLVATFGEEEAVRIFIANDEEVPSKTDIVNLIIEYRKKDLKPDSLSAEQQEHYINIFAGMLDGVFVKQKKEPTLDEEGNIIFSWSPEFKTQFIKSVRTLIDKSIEIPDEKKLLTHVALDLLAKDNSELWEKVVAEQKSQYYTVGAEDVDIEEATNKVGFGENQWTSTEKTVSHEVKAAINRLIKRKDVSYEEYEKDLLENGGNGTKDNDTFSGIAERLRYKNYAGGLFRKYLGTKTLADILERTKEIGVYEPAFWQLHRMFLEDKNLLQSFGRDIIRQYKESKILLVTDNKIKVDIEGKTSIFEYKLANHFRTVIFSGIKSNVYTEDLKKEIIDLRKKLLAKNDKGYSVNTEEATSIILDIFQKIKLDVKSKDVKNLFKIYSKEKVIDTFNKSFQGLFNHDSNIFKKTAKYKEIYDKLVEINLEIQEYKNFNSEKTKELTKKAKEKTKELEAIDFGNDGNVLDITKFIEKVRIDQPDITTLGVKNNQKTLVKFNNGYTQFFNLKHNKKALLERLTEFAQVPGSSRVNFLFGPKGLLIKTEVEGKYELNEANLELFDYADDGGIKDTLNKEGQEYIDYNERDYKIKSVIYAAKNNSYYIPTPSDSKTTHLIKFNDWELFPTDENGNTYDVIADLNNRTRILEAIDKGLIPEEQIAEKQKEADDIYKIIVSTDWFKALWNTVMKEVIDMEVAFDVMFEYDENGKIVKKEIDFALEEGYHYTLDENKKPQYLKNGKPTGKIFRFNNMEFVKNGKTYTLNDFLGSFKDKVITQEDLLVSEIKTDEAGNTRKVYKASELGVNLKEGVLQFVESTINSTKDSFFGLEKAIDEETKTKRGSFHQIISNFAINDFLFTVELQNLFGNKINDILKIVDVLKRSKDSTRAAYSLENENEGFYNITIKDVNLKEIFVSKNLKLNGEELTDGMSLVTFKEHVKRLKKEGRDKKDVNKDFITKQQKNFYGHYKYNKNTRKNEQIQIKNSELAVKKSIWQGHQLVELIDFMEKLEKELGVGVQISFESAVKRGKKDNIIDITDGNGNIVLTDEIKQKLTDAKEYCYYNNLGKVQDTDVHIVDENIRLGTQLAKIIISNLNNDNIYLNKTSKQIIEEFFNIIEANLKEANTDLLKRLQDESGKITEAKLLEYVKTEAIERNWGENIVNALTSKNDGSGETLMPMDFAPMVDRIEQFLTSLFTNNIIKQKHKGYHAFQAPNMFMENIISSQEQSESSFKGEVDWLESKVKNGKKLLGLRQINNDTLELEVLVSKWDSKFKNLLESGEPISINDIPEEALTSIGFRIPTEGKFSAFVFKVVGFLPDSMEGTIIVPDGFIQITGSDFDIDSIYVMTRHLEDDLNPVKYDEKSEPIYNSRAARENRIFDIYKEILMHPATFNEISAKSEYEDIKNATKNVLKKQEYNTNIFHQRIKVTSNILTNVNLKGKAVNYSLLASICNTAKIYTVPSKKIKKFKIDIPFSPEEKTKYKIDRFISNHIGIRELENNLGEENEYSDLNLNGEYITNYLSKLVANIMDAEKNPMAPNLGNYTIGVFAMFPLFSLPNYEYGTNFISQGVVNELIKVDEATNGMFKEKINGDEYRKVSNKIYTILSLLSIYDGTFNDDEANAFFAKLAYKTNFDEKKEYINTNNVKALAKLEKETDYVVDILNKDEKKSLLEKVKYRKEFNKDELLDNVRFYQKNEKVFDLPMMITNMLVQEAEPQEIQDKLVEMFGKDFFNLKPYLAEQLVILEQFKNLKEMDSAIIAFSSRLNADKKSVGPKLRENSKYIKDIEKSGNLNDNYNFQIEVDNREVNALKAIYNDVFMDGPKNSSYKHLASKFKYGHKSAADTLNRFFIQSSSLQIDTFYDRVLPDGYDAFKKEVNRSLLRDLEFFSGSTYGIDDKELRKEVLGINKPIIYKDFDFTKEDAEELQEFKSLSAANQLQLIKNNFSTLFPDTLLTHHLLSELNPDDRSEFEDDNVKRIKFASIKAKDRFSQQMGQMINSSNPYIRELAYNLIKYNFFMYGFNYGTNLSDIIPVAYLSGETARKLGLDIAGHMREKRINPMPLNDDMVDIFHQKNYKNSSIVPEAFNTFKRGKDDYSGKYDNFIDDYYANWNEPQNKGFLYVSAEKMYRAPEKIQQAGYVKVNTKKGDEYITKIYKKEEVIYTETIDGREKHTTIGYMFKALNKLEQFEDDFDSIFEENNNANYDENARFLYEVAIVENYVKNKEAKENKNLFDDVKYAEDMQLIATAKQSSMEVLKLIDNFAHYGSFEAKKTVKNIVTQPIEDYTDAELIYVYVRLASIDDDIFSKLKIDPSGGFHSKTRKEKEKIVEALVKIYKDEIENTDGGIVNNIRIPHKDIRELTDEELKYNISLIVEYFITRVAYTQQKVNRLKESGVDVNNEDQIYDMSRVLFHVELVRDIMLELDKIRYVKNTIDLTPTQIQINHLILTLNDYRKQFDNIVIDSDNIWEKYIIDTIKENTSDQSILQAEDISKEIKKRISMMRDASTFQMMTDSVKDTTNLIIANLIKTFKIRKNIALDNSKQHIKLFEEIMKDVTDYSEIFQTYKGRRTGKIKDLDYIKSEANRRLAEFLLDLNKITSKINTNNDLSIIDLGYIPAQAILNKSKWKIVKEYLGYFDSFDRNVKTITDSKGNTLQSVSMRFSSFIGRKELIDIPFKRDTTNGETKDEYNARLREYILQLTGLSFDNKEQIDEYNNQVVAYNNMLNSFKHGSNINYDLNEVIPLFLTEAYEYEFKKRIEHEFLMNKRKLDTKPFSRKLKTFDPLHKRYNEEDRNQIITGEASNIMKQFEMWGLVNIWDNYNADGYTFTKWGRVIQQYTSLKGLGLNPYSAVNNVTFGSIQNKIHSIADGDFDLDSNKKAGKFYYTQTALSSYFKKKPETLQAAIISYYDIMDNQTEQVELNKVSGAKTKFESGAKNTLKAMFFFQHAGEHAMQNRLLFAMMYGHRLIDGKIMSFKDFAATKVQASKPSDTLDEIKRKADENKINLKTLKEEFKTYKSLMDIHKFENGELVFTEEISQKQKAEFKDRCKNKGQRLHGIYTKEDMAVMQKYVVGRWALQFKRWMRSGWNKRFGSRFMQDSGYMESYRERDKGTYKSLIDFLGTPMRIREENDKKGVLSAIKTFEFGLAFTSMWDLIKDYKDFVANLNIYWNTMTFEDRMKSKQALVEMLNFIGIIILLSFSRGLADDDDRLDNSTLFNFYLLQLDRLKSELGGYQPISIAGAGGWYNEGKKLWSNPTATTTTFVDTGRLLLEVTSLLNGAGADEYFRTGVYSKELKAKVHFIKAIPLINQIQRWYYLPDNNRFYRLSQ